MTGKKDFLVSLKDERASGMAVDWKLADK